MLNEITFLLLFFISTQLSAKIKKVDIYTYHDMPAYVINLQKETGLYFDFVKLLNQMNSSYSFNLIFIPRKRLDYRLAQNKVDGIVLVLTQNGLKMLIKHTTPGQLLSCEIRMYLSA